MDLTGYTESRTSAVPGKISLPVKTKGYDDDFEDALLGAGDMLPRITVFITNRFRSTEVFKVRPPVLVMGLHSQESCDGQHR